MGLLSHPIWLHFVWHYSYFTFESCTLLCLASDHWWWFNTRNKNMVNIVNSIWFQNCVSVFDEVSFYIWSTSRSNRESDTVLFINRFWLVIIKSVTEIGTCTSRHADLSGWIWVANFIWYYNYPIVTSQQEKYRKVLHELSFKLWPLPESFQSKTVVIGMCYSFSNMHAIILKRLKRLVGVQTEEELLINGKDYSSS